MGLEFQRPVRGFGLIQLIRGLIPALFILGFNANVPADESAPGATKGVTLSSTSLRVPVGHALEILEDKTGRLTIDDVSGRGSQSVADQFVPSTQLVPNFGFSNSVYWLRFKLVSRHPEQKEWFLENQYPLLDYMDVYLLRAGAAPIVLRGGRMLPFATRTVEHRNLLFRMVLDYGVATDVYVRVRTESSVQLPLVLWHPDHFAHEDHHEQFILAMLYGLLVAMFSYNLLLYLSLRDRDYLWYIVYVFGLSMFQLALNGFGLEYLWPDSPRWASLAIPVFLYVALLAVIEFSRSFLNLRVFLPKVDLAARLMAYLVLAMLLSVGILSYSVLIKVGTVLSMLSSAAILVIAVYVWVRLRYVPARYFVLAWAALLLGIVVYSLKTFGVLPATFVTSYSMQIGAALEVLLLSIAMAHRLKVLKADNERLQRETTARLEEKVNERTAELSATIERLKQTQAELVQAEKLASLGALVAGVAHELNTPIGNAVTMASGLEDATRELEAAISAGSLRKAALASFVETALPMTELINRSCARAATLIASFKQVAVDQTSEKRRSFDLRALVEDNIAALRPSFRDATWVLDVDISAGIRCDSYPGPLGQVIASMVQNAVAHAFDGRAQGRMTVAARMAEDSVEMTFADDGKGMSTEIAARIFEPFYTTRLGQGGSGLGLSIALNIVTGVLGGSLQVSSVPGQGTRFTVRFPRIAPQRLGN